MSFFVRKPSGIIGRAVCPALLALCVLVTGPDPGRFYESRWRVHVSVTAQFRFRLEGALGIPGAKQGRQRKTTLIRRRNSTRGTR